MERGDIVRAPFEYSDLTGGKRRPACIVSVEVFNRTGEVVIAMITASPALPPRDLVTWYSRTGRPRDYCAPPFSERDAFSPGHRMSCPSREVG